MADLGKVLSEDQWRRLPLELRQRWWRLTEYGKKDPEAELMKEALEILQTTER